MSRLLCAVALSLFAVPALAGSLNISNGKGIWQPTQCQRPVPPAFVGLGPDANAATLNAATASYNLFVQQTQEYSACLSNEAKADAESSNAIMTQSVERQMQDAKAETDRVRAQLFGGGAPAPAPYVQPKPPQLPPR